MSKRVLWSDLVRRQPKLKALLKEARAIDGSGEHFCANRVWYGGFKQRLCQLVGWEAEYADDVLRTSEAYDVAYDKIYQALPPCRDCLCWPG